MTPQTPLLPLKEHLESRHLLKDYTHEALFDKFGQGGKYFYLGVDLSEDSMTIGNYAALMLALNIMSYGNKCYLIVGGATSTIGNPGGKDKERPIRTPEQLAHNETQIAGQLERLCINAAAVTGKTFDFEVINNKTFFEDFNTLDFMREVGRYVTVNRMLTKDLVRKRVTEPDQSISYAEFSYMLIMGYDYYKLYTEHDVTLQVGGSDERDGMLAGMEIIRKKLGRTEDDDPVGAITLPLVMDSNGKKFGKSEGNAIRLDPKKNSPYVAYNYFINASDEDVENYLKIFTFISEEDIMQIVADHNDAPHLRAGQQRLAYAVVEMIFGTSAAKQCEQIREVLYGKGNIRKNVEQLDGEGATMLTASMSSIVVHAGDSLPSILTTLTELGHCASNGEAKKDIKAGCVRIFDKKITDAGYVLMKEDFTNNGIALIKKGKKSVGAVVNDGA